MQINEFKTDRGFARLTFKDTYKNDCSLQKSSIASDDRIWLGAHQERMHLDRAGVVALLPYLIGFVETGEIPESPAPWGGDHTSLVNNMGLTIGALVAAAGGAITVPRDVLDRLSTMSVEKTAEMDGAITYRILDANAGRDPAGKD